MTTGSLNSGLGIAGRLAARFQSASITPLIALVALLLGVFAASVTPREEEPQINVTMANVLIPYRGASAKQVEQAVSIPAEQVLAQMSGLEHVMSVSRPGLAVLTVQFKVGVPRTEALVRLYDTINSHKDWLPSGLGVGEPLVKPKGIDDVPILTLTLYDKRSGASSYDLERIAHSMEAELKRVTGTREVATVGGTTRAIKVIINPAALQAAGLTVSNLNRILQSANSATPAGELVSDNHTIIVDGGRVLENAQSVSDLVVAVRNARPVFLRDVAQVVDGPVRTDHSVWFGTAGKGATEYPAVTLSVTKKAGENAADVTRRLRQRIDQLTNTLIPEGVGVEISRDYGVTANDKAIKLIEKLVFATLSVVALVAFTMGRREAAIVGIAVALTLTATLFASWAWGFTLNRVSLFALIFSIGILVDDAIVVVENIHRHLAATPSRKLAELIPAAVDEVGGPTILATLTVIAALLPMAFVGGLMGPYMAPIPINASMGMLLSLGIAFVVTPWLAARWLHAPAGHGDSASHVDAAERLEPWVRRIVGPFVDPVSGQRRRRWLWAGVVVLIVLSVLLPVAQWVVLKMLPFDNKSEFQVVLDSPAGTPLEATETTLAQMSQYLATVPEVRNYEVYAGLSAPINFNGLIRQYYLRSGGDLGDIQVNLVDKHHRDSQSHAIAERVRPALARIAQAHGAVVKVVEVPPGPPVLAPIVAEVYGPDEAGRMQVADAVRSQMLKFPGMVDVDSSSIAAAARDIATIDRVKAAQAGVDDAEVVATLRAGLAGIDSTYLQDDTKYPAPIRLQLPDSTQGDLGAAMNLDVHAANGALVPLGSLLQVQHVQVEQPLYHKDLMPVVFVVGDVAGHVDSPLYGLFGIRSELSRIVAPDGGKIHEYFTEQPRDSFRGYALKWDGEWQVTYETFRDMGIAYAVGLVLIYLLVVAQFGSYLMPLIIMAPIPLTIIGVLPGHALLRSQFTATSMIGMIALAGIIVRNSILLVDFIQLQVAAGTELGWRWCTPWPPEPAPLC